MLDSQLTRKCALSEIGEIVSTQTALITSQSSITIRLRKCRKKLDELFRHGKAVQETGFDGGVHANDMSLGREERLQVEGEISTVIRGVQGGLENLLARITENNEQIPWPKFKPVFDEAVINAIEHGTHFCTSGNVEIRVFNGRNGILAIISQPTKGPSRKKIREAVKPKTMERLATRTSATEIRGVGLKCFARGDKSRVWFERGKKKTEQFSVLILQTKNTLISCRNESNETLISKSLP